jgi:hypothetical protein
MPWFLCMTAAQFSGWWRDKSPSAGASSSIEVVMRLSIARPVLKKNVIFELYFLE